MILLLKYIKSHIWPKMSIFRIMVSFLSEMTSLILVSIIYQFRFLHLTSVWHKIDVTEVSFLWFWCHLPMITDVIIMKMPSLPLSRQKKRSSKGFISLWSFVLCEYSVFVLTYLRWFQPLRKYFQPERIGKLFTLGELCLILASIDFVGTKSRIWHSLHYTNIF